MHLLFAFVALALAASLATAAHADLLGDLKSKAGNYTLPAVGGSTIGNAAGVLQYCKLKTKACDYVLKNARSLV